MPLALQRTGLFLESVNIMLRHIQEDSYSTALTFDEINPPPAGTSQDVREAYNILLNTSITVQSEPHWWNTFTKTLTPDVNNKIALLSSTTLSVKTPTLSLKDGYLYDDVNDTDEFTEEQTIDLIMGVMFIDLAEQVRRYITYRAAQLFQQQRLGSGEYDKFIQKELERATVDYNIYCTNYGGYNITKNPDVQDFANKIGMWHCRPIFNRRT